MAKLPLKFRHVKIDDNGRYRYRRRVPQKLQKALGKSEFSKVLGISEKEAQLAYGEYHRHVEQEIALGKGKDGRSTPFEHREQIISFMKNHNLQLDGPGRLCCANQLTNGFPLTPDGFIPLPL